MDGTVSALIARIYQSVQDDRSFDVALDAVLTSIGAQVGLVVATGLPEPGVVAIQVHGATGSHHHDALAEYHDGLWRDDPTMAHFVADPAARFFDTALHRDRTTHLADPYTAWNRAHIGADHWMVGHAIRDLGSSFGIAAHLKGTARAFEDYERALFRLAFDHFERAQWLATRPPDLTRSDEALLVIDPRHRIHAASPAADALLTIGDGLVAPGGVLTTSDPRQARRLGALIESALNAVARGGVGGAMLVERGGGGGPLVLVVDPLPDQAELASFARGALVRIVDPDAATSPVAVAHWRGLWGLTAAETRAAAALVEHGFDLRAAAGATGITYATIRTQLAAIFAKTRTRSQPELMRLLTRIPG